VVSAVVVLAGMVVGTGKYGGVKLSRYRLPPNSSCHTMRPYVIHRRGCCKSDSRNLLYPS
jgi:hypothetical protein